MAVPLQIAAMNIEGLLALDRSRNSFVGQVSLQWDTARGGCLQKQQQQQQGMGRQSPGQRCVQPLVHAQPQAASSICRPAAGLVSMV